jgi:hypothetical protein
LSSTTWLNHLVLGHPLGLLPLKFNSNTFLSILVLSIPFRSLNQSNCFSFKSLHNS